MSWEFIAGSISALIALITFFTKYQSKEAAAKEIEYELSKKEKERLEKALLKISAFKKQHAKNIEEISSGVSDDRASELLSQDIGKPDS